MVSMGINNKILKKILKIHRYLNVCARLFNAMLCLLVLMLDILPGSHASY